MHAHVPTYVLYDINCTYVCVHTYIFMHCSYEAVFSEEEADDNECSEDEEPVSICNCVYNVFPLICHSLSPTISQYVPLKYKHTYKYPVNPPCFLKNCGRLTRIHCICSVLYVHCIYVCSYVGICGEHTVPKTIGAMAACVQCVHN